MLPRTCCAACGAERNRAGQCPVCWERRHARRHAEWRARFLAEHRFTVDAATGCWVWPVTGKSHYGPYARCYVAFKGDPYLPHLSMCETPSWDRPRVELDHLCRNRACINPWHLEPVTARENRRRGRGAGKNWTPNLMDAWLGRTTYEAVFGYRSVTGRLVGCATTRAESEAA
jgi:hypothetical protein